MGDVDDDDDDDDGDDGAVTDDDDRGAGGAIFDADSELVWFDVVAVVTVYAYMRDGLCGCAPIRAVCCAPHALTVPSCSNLVC